MYWRRAVAVIALLSLPHVGAAEAYYLGAEAGMSTWDAGITNLTGSAGLDDEDVAVRVLLGVELDENLAFELQFADYGKAALSGNSGDTAVIGGTPVTFTANGVRVGAEADGFGLGVRYQWHLGVVRPFVRAGFHWWDARFSSNASFASDSGHDGFYGGGVAFRVGSKAEVRVSYEQYEMDAIDANLELLAAGFIWPLD